ncbi:MAG: YjgP/YjgQ family permease [Candidatus Eisenbacteria bacterium]|uniref:YjgP/YjgQ family permease n=1 Tax=Eiseniibacteriota bacterium TaxID=2212470 RepID=A0A849SMV0_UNCEI|nr:YjgP/YjgQ family permease [Candidatus Eisenbacteria bacterium]
MRLLRSYILRLHLVPFLLGFGVITFILVMDTVFDHLDLIVNRGVPVVTVVELFLLSLGFVIALSVPCAVLVSALMTFGRLSQDNEITALRASGVHLFSVMIGPLIASAVLAMTLVGFNHFVLPETNHSFATLMLDIFRMRPTVRLQEGVFIRDFPGYDLLVRSVNGRTNELRGVIIYQREPGTPPKTILAEKGRLSYTPDGATVMLELEDGEIHDVPSEAGDASRYRRLRFKRHVINIMGAGGLLERSVREVRGNREMNAFMLLAQRDTTARQLREATANRRHRLEALGASSPLLRAFDQSQSRAGPGVGSLFARVMFGADPTRRLTKDRPDLRGELDLWQVERGAHLKRIANLSVEFHKKLALPFACVVFVLIGAPIGMRVRRTGPAVAFLSVVFFLFYWLCLIGGEELANRLWITPWLAMWLPNAILGLLGLRWTLAACEVRLPWHRRTRSSPAARPALA